MDTERHAAHTEALRRICLASKNGASELSLTNLRLDRLPKELGDLKALTKLLVDGCLELTDISSLRLCTNLEVLDLRACPHVTDMSSLRGLQRLRELYLGTRDTTTIFTDKGPFSSLADIGALTDLAALETIILSGCKQLQDLRPLTALTALQHLDLSQCGQLQDLRPLTALTALQHLNLSWCGQLQDLPPLTALTALQHLNLRWCGQLQGLPPLSALTALQYLDLSECGQLQDLPPLSALTGLKTVSLYNTGLLDCSISAQPLVSWRELKELYANKLIAAPSELGSNYSNDNALPRLRGWQQDLTVGEAPNSRVKLLVLGNGVIGKTQICRRLCGEDFDPSVPSTHGISLGQVQLIGASGDQPAVDANYWDFGGQDVYLGTHALFLDERAIYVIAWAPQHENSEEFEQDGVSLRNRPLTYWLEYVRSLAGPQAPVIVVQAQCDRELDVLHAPVPVEHGFERLRITSASAKQEEGMERLQMELKSAARYQLERYGKVRLPASWVAVGEELRARIHEKTLPRTEFDELCCAKHGAAVPSVVLEYLHRSGRVFWREGLFDNHVVLDMAWALDGVYAVLERNTALPEVHRQAGRFSPQLLGALVWRDYGEAERELFLSLMEQCQICFKVAEDVFIAPALLPKQAAMESDVQQVWREATPGAVVRLDYAFLHEGVLRAMLCGIGEKAGVHAVYWAYGVCFFDVEHKSAVRIGSELPDVAAGQVGGRITVEAAGPGAIPLAEHLVASIKRLNIGHPPQVTWELGQARHEAPIETETPNASEPAFTAVRPAQPPRMKGEAQPVYVSYAWGGKSDTLVDEFECRLPDNFKLILDKSTLRPGDWISRFMTEIGRADLVLVVLSDKYLRSVYCMRELKYLFDSSLGEREEFMRKVVPLRVGAVRISRALDRTAHTKHWKQEHDKLEAALADLDHASVGDADRTELLLMKDFQHRVSDMLAWVADTLMPQGTDLHTEGIDAAINLMQQRTLTLIHSRHQSSDPLAAREG